MEVNIITQYSPPITQKVQKIEYVILMNCGCHFSFVLYICDINIILTNMNRQDITEYIRIQYPNENEGVIGKSIRI